MVATLIADELQRGRQELQLGLARTETLISFKEGFRRRLPIDIGKLEKADEEQLQCRLSGCVVGPFD